MNQQNSVCTAGPPFLEHYLQLSQPLQALRIQIPTEAWSPLRNSAARITFFDYHHRKKMSPLF